MRPKNLPYLGEESSVLDHGPLLGQLALLPHAPNGEQDEESAGQNDGRQKERDEPSSGAEDRHRRRTAETRGRRGSATTYRCLAGECHEIVRLPTGAEGRSPPADETGPHCLQISLCIGWVMGSDLRARSPAQADSRSLNTDHKRITLIMAEMDRKVRAYLSRIGRKGGKKSRRTLDPETARRMVAVREARRAFRRFHSACFWSYRKDLVIGVQDVPWVAEQLMKHGGRDAWEVAHRLCR